MDNKFKTTNLHFLLFLCISFKTYQENLILNKVRQEQATLLEDQFPFMAVSGLIFLRTRNVSHKFVARTKTHILCPITFSRKSCRM
jgi:hypothetical protein